MGAERDDRSTYSTTHLRSIIEYNIFHKRRGLVLCNPNSTGIGRFALQGEVEDVGYRCCWYIKSRFHFQNLAFSLPPNNSSSSVFCISFPLFLQFDATARYLFA